MKQLYIWSDTNIVNELYKLDPTSRAVVYCAEEYIVNDEFNPFKLNNSKNISYIFGSAGIEKTIYKQYIDNSKCVDFWYNFWLYLALWQIDLTNLTTPTNSCLFISLNYNAHDHRCLLLDTLEKYNLIKNNIISWHGVNISTTYKWNYWNPKVMQLSDTFAINQRQSCIPAEYNDVLFNLIAETTIEVVFLTEKTWHAILCEKPFLVLGAPGFHAFLKSKGYKLFDSIIDYSFDQEENLEKRIEMLIQELKKLENQNYQAIYQDIKYICKHNKQLAIEHIKSQEGIPENAKQFKYYQMIIKEAQCRLDILA